MAGKILKQATHQTAEWSRRRILAGLVALPFLPTQAIADAVIELTWADLMPEGADPLPPGLSGVVPHGAGSLISQQPEATGFRTEWNGKTVRMPGYLVPLDFDGTATTLFILVPYVGACIHVPPPPANQLVLVTAQEPYEAKGLFEPVWVTGVFGTSDEQTSLADIGYAMSARTVEPYSG